jgi:hypothetical protein
MHIHTPITYTYTHQPHTHTHTHQPHTHTHTHQLHTHTHTYTRHRLRDRRTALHAIPGAQQERAFDQGPRSSAEED